jgi:hypothetical protein
MHASQFVAVINRLQDARASTGPELQADSASLIRVPARIAASLVSREAEGVAHAAG